MSVEAKLLKALKAAVGPENVLTSKEDLIPYAFDGTAALKEMPGAVVFVTETCQVSEILRLANETGTAVVTRGLKRSIWSPTLFCPCCRTALLQRSRP